MRKNSLLKDNKKIKAILIIVLFLIIITASISFLLLSNNIKKGPTGPFLTTFYEAISNETAYNLIKSNETPVIIIDIRNCKCNYNSGHLPNATWNTNPISFYNLTEDLLIYSNDNSDSIEFCEQLLNNTYSRLFYLDGGYDNWKNAGYPTEK